MAIENIRNDRFMDQLKLLSGDMIVAVVMLMVSAFGVTCNLLSIYLIIKSETLRCVYGLICGACCVSNIVMLTASFAWSEIVLHLNVKELSWFGIVCAHVANTSFYSSVCLHFLGTINRYIAICYPARYMHLFTLRTTIRCISLIWMACFAVGTVYHIDGCAYYFKRSKYNWTFEKTLCGEIQSLFVDFITIFALHIAMLALDIFVLYKIRKMNKEISSILVTSRRKKETRFFFQSCASNILFICCETSFSIVTRPLTSQWLLFLLGTQMWQLQHALDGLILVVVEWRNRRQQTKNSSVVITAWSNK